MLEADPLLGVINMINVIDVPCMTTFPEEGKLQTQLDVTQCYQCAHCFLAFRMTNTQSPIAFEL